MKSLLISLLIGITAGLIDIVPMIIKKIDKRDTLSAFIHYLVLGLIIPYVNWDIAPWFRGIIIALITALPLMITVCEKDRKAIIPMCFSSVILGAGIGMAGAIFIG